MWFIFILPQSQLRPAVVPRQSAIAEQMYILKDSVCKQYKSKLLNYSWFTHIVELKDKPLAYTELTFTELINDYFNTD